MRNKSYKQVQDGDAILERIMQPNCCYHCQDIATIFDPCKHAHSSNSEQTTDTFLRDHYDY